MWSHFFRVPGAADKRRASRFAYVSPGYFDTLQIPLRSGRDFPALDNARSRARHGGQRELRAQPSRRGGSDRATLRTLAEPGFPEITYEIVGVVGDTKYADLRDENCWCPKAGESMAPIAYVPIAQNPSPYAWAPVIVALAHAWRGDRRRHRAAGRARSIPPSPCTSSS